MCSTPNRTHFYPITGYTEIPHLNIFSYAGSYRIVTSFAWRIPTSLGRFMVLLAQLLTGMVALKPCSGCSTVPKARVTFMRAMIAGFEFVLTPKPQLLRSEQRANPWSSTMQAS